MSQVLPVTINAPGQWGVNEQEQDQLLHPNWATVADGLVLNDSSRLQGRGALTLTSTDGAAAEILRQFVYVNSAGTEVVISTTATKIISGIADLDDASTDITSSTTPTNGFWKFANFNGKVIGWQASHTPIVWSGSGDFADITAASGTLPDGDAMTAAFGRVWAVDDDHQTVRYSALLDETRWDAADGGGSIDMRNVWTQGMDRVTAIAAFGSTLVIFGRKHVIFYTDGQGSTIGIDPTQMYVVDTIEGTGCVARDSVANIGEGDLVFLSEVGLQSLRRIVVQKDNPLVDISWQIADRLSTAIKAEVVSATDLRTWTGHYIPETGQYMLVHTTNEDVYAFHMGGRTQDERGREVTPITIWDTSVLTNIRGFITLRTGITYTSGSSTHEIYKYDTAASLDQGSAGIAVRYESGWVRTENPEYDTAQKTLKFATATISNSAGIDSAVSFLYGTDYTTSLDSLAATSADETRLVLLYDTTGDVEGQHFKFGISDTSFGLKVLQQYGVFMSPGRVAMTHIKTGQTYDDTSVVGPALIEDGIVSGTSSESSSTTRTVTNLHVPAEADGIVVVVAGANLLNTISAMNYGAAGGTTAIQRMEVAGEGAIGSVFVITQVFGTSPTTSSLVFTFSSAEGDAFTAHVYPFKDLGAVPSNTDYDEAVDSDPGGYTALSLSISTPTANNSVMLVVVDYASGTEPTAGPWLPTVSDTRFRFVDARPSTWLSGTAPASISVLLYQDSDGTAVAPTVDSDPEAVGSPVTDGYGLAAYLFELPVS